ncbi:metal-dependent hydrolase [Halopelagius fulvigenes]|uniref:Metal-dependent hydrolase n=1 Tax=Halopelagius fulvigenes TaxID=1198324 RepID=A0ABD5TZF0_9EURY
MLLSLTVTEWRPELGGIVALCAFFGGVFPDFDAFRWEHRKTLHFPVYYGVVTLLLLSLAVVSDSVVVVAGLYFFGAAALHCYTDYFVGIDKPSDETDGDGVLYLHPRGKWVGPKKIIDHAGSSGDLLVGILLAVPPLLYYSDLPFWLTVLSLTWSVLYFGKRLYSRHKRESSEPS